MSGPNPELENRPDYVIRAMEKFKVEVDVWKLDGTFWLGHDGPSHQVEKEFLLEERLLLHCKNLEAFIELSRYPFAESFFHDSELVALTSRGRKVFHSGALLPQNIGGDAILVDLEADRDYVQSRPSGILTDFPEKLDSGNVPLTPFDLLILDIDGVLTSGVKFYGPDGAVVAKTYADKDFTAIKRFLRHGVSVCFLSGDSNVNQAMAQDRGIDFYNAKLKSGKLDKSDFLEELRSKYRANRVAYVGDDYYDITLLAQVDFSFCPSDAIREVREVCSVTIPRPGGMGVVEELYDMTMKGFPQSFASDSYRP